MEQTQDTNVEVTAETVNETASATYETRIQTALERVSKAFTDAMEVDKVQLEIIMEVSRFGGTPRIIPANDLLEVEQKMQAQKEAMKNAEESNGETVAQDTEVIAEPQA